MASLGRAYTEGLCVLHRLRERTSDSLQRMKETNATQSLVQFQNKFHRGLEVLRSKTYSDHPAMEDFQHTYRRKTRLEMVRISAAVMGIEFCYAAETAFVSPTLLRIGVSHVHMTLIWCLSPLVGFFLTPVLGSLSDRCRSRLGRRRPFILLLSVGILLGLILVPNGKDLGMAFGDYEPPPAAMQNDSVIDEQRNSRGGGRITTQSSWSQQLEEPRPYNNSFPQSSNEPPAKEFRPTSHTWGIVFTIIGTVLLDFDSDACQSPSRAYLLDVTVPEDQAKGLSTFTIMAGLGGSLGYALGGINWDATFVGSMFGGHVRAVFTLILFIFLFCVTTTIFSFREIPLDVLLEGNEVAITTASMTTGEYFQFKNDDDEDHHGQADCGGTQPIHKTYGTVDFQRPMTMQNGQKVNGDLQVSENVITQETTFNTPNHNQVYSNSSTDHAEETVDAASLVIAEGGDNPVTLQQYLLSIIFMPQSLKLLCITNLFCWMSLVCYSLYFTDFVGEAIFEGDPQAPLGSPKHDLYEQGVRFGCWGMALYSLSCSAYSFMIDKFIRRFRAKTVYICGQLIYCIGMVIMAVLPHKVCVILFSCTAGVMYSTLFTMPYLLVAHYHANNMFGIDDVSTSCNSRSSVRGLGTDVAIVSSMVFLAQFLLSAVMGSLVQAAGSTVAVVCSAAVLSFCGAVSASQVIYLDL